MRTIKAIKQHVMIKALIKILITVKLFVFFFLFHIIELGDWFEMN